MRSCWNWGRNTGQIPLDRLWPGKVLRLQWKDIDLDGGKVILLITKNDRPRTVHVPSSAITALRALKKAKVASLTNVFLATGGVPLKMSAFQTRWKRLRKATGLKDFRWHDLRHSCASFLAAQGASSDEIGY
jgi:integrase